MDLTFSSFKNEVKTSISNKLSGQIKNILLENISKELNNLKSTINTFSKFDKSLQPIIQKLDNFKITFQNLPSLEKLIDNILKALPNDIAKEPNIQSIIKNLQTILKQITSHKTLYHLANNLKDDIKELGEYHRITPKLAKLINKLGNKLENFSQLIQKQSNPKDLQTSFKEIKTIIKQIKNEPDFKNIPIQISKSIDKKLDTISLQIDFKDTTQEQIKQFNTMLKEIINTTKTDKINLLNKHSLIKNIGNITKNLEELSTLLPNEKKYIPTKKVLENFTQDIKNINLKENIKQSGIFYESKLTTLISEDNQIDKTLEKDVKAILLKLKSDNFTKEHHQLNSLVDKTLNQINAVQTNAIITQSAFTYIPFNWQDLKDGSFSISQLKKKDGFSCKIELDLESYGKVDILMLFNQNILSLKMDIKDKNLKNLLHQHNKELQNALNKLGYNASIFFTKAKQDNYEQAFEYEANLGVDIKT